LGGTESSSNCHDGSEFRDGEAETNSSATGPPASSVDVVQRSEHLTPRNLNTLPVWPEAAPSRFRPYRRTASIQEPYRSRHYQRSQNHPQISTRRLPSKNGPIDFRFRSKVLAWVVLHSIYIQRKSCSVEKRDVIHEERSDNRCPRSIDMSSDGV
jgi:hypothetical protein